MRAYLRFLSRKPRTEQASASAPEKPCVMKRRRSFWRNNSGAAVEFALVATPFLALLFAIIETALVFFAGQVLETAVQDSARAILTGQAQQTGNVWTQAQFKQFVCTKVYGLFDCVNGIYVDVKKFSSFQNVTITNPVVNGTFNNNFTYDAGGPGDIIVVRLHYLWPVSLPTLGFNLADVNGSKRLISATAAFRNEPF